MGGTSRLSEKILGSRWLPVGIFLAGCLVFGMNLGRRDFWNPDEGDFAEIAREMRERGDYLVPTLNGKPYSEKPPLFYWSVLLSEAVVGEPYEFSARLPSVLAGAGGLVIAFWFGRRFFSAKAGLLAAALLGTSFQYLWRSSYLQTDMLFTFFCGLSFWLLWKLLEQEEPRFLRDGLPFYLALTLAILTKGPLAAVLVGLTALGFLAWEGRLFFLRKLFLVRGFFLVAALAGWWYIVVGSEAGSGFLRGAIVREHLMRFFDSDSHNQPPYYYLFTIWSDLAPWSLFFPFVLWAAWKGRGDRKVRFLLVWFGATFLFLSICSSKQGKYLLPVFPAAATLLAWNLLKDWDLSRYQKPIIYYLSAIFIAVGVAGITLSLAGNPPEFLASALARQDLSPELAVRLAPVLHELAAAGLLSLCFRERGTHVMAGYLAGGIAILFLTLSFFYPELNGLKSVRPLMERTAARMESGARLAVYGSFRGGYAYYSGRLLTEIKVDPPDEDESRRQLEEFLALPGPAYCLVSKVDWSRLGPSFWGQFWVLDQAAVGNRSLVLISNRPVNKGK